MRRFSVACLIAVIAALLSQEARAEVRAGVAYEAFELPGRVPLAGYSRRHGKPSAGRHDPVGVRALVLQDGPATAALVSCDLLIVDEHLFEAVRRQLIAQDLPETLTLVLAATHTHSGPGAYGKRFLEKISMGHFDPEVFEAIVDTVARAVERAYAELAPVRIAAAAGPTQGLVKNRVEEAGPTDPELTVLGFYEQTGTSPLAVVINFAAHPTTLGAWNMELSADYPGVAMRELEQRFPGAVAFFFAGAVGDQAPVKSGDKFGRAEWIGHALAERAVALLQSVQPQAPRGLNARQESLPLPPAKVRVGRLVLPRWLGGRLVDDDAALSLVVVGQAAFIGVPCDLAASLGGRLKESARAQGLQPVVVGFANDYIGYCMPASLYEAKQYESSMAFNGPKAGELVVEHLLQLLNDVTGHR